MGRPDPADPYALLGVDPAATVAEIRRAFRRLARGAHPDAGGDPIAFVALRRAHDTLTDPVARARLDAARSEAAASPSTTGADAGSPVDVTRESASAGGADVGRDLAAEVARVRERWPGVAARWRFDAASVVPVPAADAFVGAVPTGVGGGVDDAPAVVAVGRLDGEVRWRAGLPAPAVPSPGVVEGLVVVATTDGIVHGLDARTGTTRWELRLTTEPSALLVHEGAIVVVADDVLTAVRPGGEVSWVLRPHGGVDAAVSAGGVVAVRTGVGAVVGVDLRTGDTRWWLRDSAPWAYPPVMSGAWLWLPGGGSGGNGGRRVVAVDPRNGSAAHVLDAPAPVVSVHDVDALLVVRDTGGGLTAVRGGRPLWRMVVPSTPSEPRGTSGAVVVATTDGVLRFLSARHGTELHQVAIERPRAGLATLLLWGEVVVVGGTDGGVVAHRVVTPAGGPSPR